MAISVRNLLYDWFGITLRRPTHQQFRNLIDSFWHKTEDTIPIENIDNLPATLAAKADTAYVDAAVSSAVVGLLDDRGNYDASINEWPVGNGSGDGGALLKGDVYFVSVGGTWGGIVVNAGDTIRALIDTPGQVDGNWAVMRKENFVATNWGSIGGDIGSQTDLVNLLDIFHYYNLLIELNTSTPTGVLSDILAFSGAVFTENPNLVINSFYQDGLYLKINCRGLKVLPTELFFYNSEIVSIRDASGIEEIHQNAFQESTIQSIDFPFVKLIKLRAFKYCYYLTNVSLNSLEVIDSTEAFFQTDIRNLYLPKLLTLGDFSFGHCDNLKNVHLPSVKIIADYSFYLCSKLEFITLASCTKMGDSVFSNCINLITVLIPNMFDMGGSVFDNCPLLSKIVCLENSTSISDVETANGISAKILAN